MLGGSGEDSRRGWREANRGPASNVAQSTTAIEARRGRDAAPTPGDVHLQRVTKRFGDVVAVDDLTLGIERGEFFSLLGPSGCGKTTTLRIIGGFEEPTTGSIRLGGADVTTLPAYRRDVNTVFQSYALFPHLSVYENVAFGLRRKKVERQEVDRRVNESLGLVDLPGMQKRKPGQLSGGQQQRVAIARALINEPKLMLADEPTGNLDTKTSEEVMAVFQALNETGKTVVLITHEQDIAEFARRVVVFRDGKVDRIQRRDELKIEEGIIEGAGGQAIH